MCSVDVTEPVAAKPKIFGRALAAIAMGLIAVAPMANAVEDLPLITAIKNLDIAGAKKLIEGSDVDLDVAEGDGMTALHWAAYQDEAQLVDMLLSNGADANATTRYGITPLGLAAENRNKAIAAALLTSGADPNLDNSGQSALHISARTNALDVAKLLIGRGASVNARTDWQAVTPLMVAASERNPQIVDVLIAAGSEVNAIAAETSLFIGPGDESTTYTQIPRGGMTPLLFAARDGCTECVPLLLDAGADVNYRDPGRVTALNLAIYNGHYDTAALLLDRGADPNDGSVFLAVEMNNLVANGVNADNYPVPRTQNTISSVGILEYLLAHGANPDHELLKEIQSRNLGFWRPGYLTGLTPLQRAAEQADLESIRALLDAGADASLPTRARTKGTGGYGVTTGGETPLIFAVRSWTGVPAGALGNRPGKLAYRSRVEGDSAEALSILLSRGADPNAADWAGESALHYAARIGADDLIQLLVSGGSILDARNDRGATPLDLVVAQRVAAQSGQTGLPEPASRDPEAIAATEAVLRRLMSNTGAEAE